MSRYWLAALGGGAASVLIYMLPGFGSFGGALLAQFAALPLYLVGLSLGLTAATAAAAAAAIGMMFFGGALVATIFLFVNVAPALILVRQGLLSRTDEQGQTHWYPVGLLVVSLCAVGVGVYTVAALWFAAQPTGFEGAVRDYVDGLLGALFAANAADQRAAVGDLVTAMLPGVVAASWLVMVAVNAALAQGLLIRFGRNMRPSPDIVGMTFPNWFPVAAAVVALLGLVLPGALGYYGANLAIIVILPFFFMGLAVVHALCRRPASGKLLLTLFYVLLMIFGWPVLFVAALGLIEQWVGLRRRFA